MQYFDFIVIGAGSAGGVLAHELSANPRLKVLLLEEGPVGDRQLIAMPKGLGKLLQDKETGATYMTDYERAPGRPDIWVRGRLLGGSSSVNGCVWHRGQQSDFDSFASFGVTGWSWSDFESYFKKLERHELGETRTHGGHGPIPVTTHRIRTRMAEALLSAGVEMGLPRISDLYSADHDSIGYIQQNVDRRGRRVGSFHGFLSRARRRTNLSIITEARVDAILFEGKRATGVRCTLAGNRTADFQCNVEVILSAGAIASPQILQRSGIGPSNLLKSLGVTVIADSPLVGSNMKEHHVMSLQYRAHRARDSHNRELRGWRLLKNGAQHFLTGSSVLSTGMYEIAAHLRTRHDLLRPDLRLMYAPVTRIRDQGMELEDAPGVQITALPLKPQSTGEITIRSADPSSAPRIHPNYFSAPGDLIVAIASVRIMRRLMSAPAVRPFLVGETAETSSAQSDDEIAVILRRYGTAGYHATGTCAMGATPAVIDSALKVRGVQGLRVVDCSIFPDMISGHTNAPVMAAALRASDLILSEHRP